MCIQLVLTCADGRPDAFNMGSLRTELHIPAAFHTTQSIEEQAESDGDPEEEEEVDGEDDMVLGSTPQVHSLLQQQAKNTHRCTRPMSDPQSYLCNLTIHRSRLSWAYCLVCLRKVQT